MSKGKNNLKPLEVLKDFYLEREGERERERERERENLNLNLFLFYFRLQIRQDASFHLAVNTEL